MLKILGALMILGVCGRIGYMLKKNLIQRVVELKAWLNALKIMETEIKYGVNPLPMVLGQAGEQTGGLVGCFLSQVSSDLQLGKGQTAGQLWQDNLAIYQPKLALTPWDIEVALNLGLGLGVSDMSDQARRLELSRQQFLRCLDTAEENAAKMGKVWMACGWAGGVVLVLLWL